MEVFLQPQRLKELDRFHTEQSDSGVACKTGQR